MKNTAFILPVMAATLLLAGVQEAHAQKYRKHQNTATASTSYIKGTVGRTFSHDENWSRGAQSGEIDVENAMHYGAAIGSRLGQSTRMEFEASYRKPDIDDIQNAGGTQNISGDLRTWALMLNGYYDFYSKATFSPYLGAGIGMARHKLEAGAAPAIGFNAIDDSSWNFAWQGGGGLSTQLSPKAHIDTGYRYLATTDPDFGNMNMDYGSHEVSVSLRYGF